ncbi:hypothetical protein [Caudoviricetes sp.]|nr:hypothetical protein [Caudoviricetes sp.]
MIPEMNKRIVDLESKLESFALKIQQLERANRNTDNEEILSGTSHPTANSDLKMVHRLGRIPTKVIVVKGCVYIKDFDDKYIDVRSTLTSQDFKIIVS